MIYDAAVVSGGCRVVAVDNIKVVADDGNISMLLLMMVILMYC